MRRECRERFPPPPISKKTASQRSRHASRHVRDARAVMHVGIAYLGWRGKRSRHSRRMRTRDFVYLARGPSMIIDYQRGSIRLQNGRVLTIIPMAKFASKPLMYRSSPAVWSNFKIYHLHIDGLVQEIHNSSALAMELRVSCTNPSIYHNLSRTYHNISLCVSGC